MSEERAMLGAADFERIGEEWCGAQRLPLSHLASFMAGVRAASGAHPALMQSEDGMRERARAAYRKGKYGPDPIGVITAELLTVQLETLEMAVKAAEGQKQAPVVSVDHDLPSMANVARVAHNRACDDIAAAIKKQSTAATPPAAKE